jgi:CubicO group peptidase (beta-lactamase class C family)
LLLLQACSGGESRNVTPTVDSLETPVETGDGWEIASLAEVGIDAQPIIDAVNQIRRGAYNEIHGLVIVKEGRLVLEEYGSGQMFEYDPPDNLGPTINFDRDEPHIVHSVSKSYMSTLVGIAVQEGYITSEDTSLLAFFPEHADPNQPGKADILLTHVMSMSSGLEWNEWDVDVMDFANNDAIRYQTAPDPCAYFLGKNLLHEPGTTFYYNTGGFQMMGEVIRRATAMRVNQFADQHIFAPLGITDYHWPQIEHGPVYIVGDLFLRPRDMAKFGQLVLEDGRWDGQQIVPAGWFGKASTEAIPVSHTGYKGYSGYGFHWWLKTFNIGGVSIEAIHADGLAGQAIMVFPALDLVVVVTSGNYNNAELEHALVADYVLPAVID